jgi:hypothetical protein
VPKEPREAQETTAEIKEKIISSRSRSRPITNDHVDKYYGNSGVGVAGLLAGERG